MSYVKNFLLGEDMSNNHSQNEEEQNFECWLEEEGFEGPIGTADSDSFYECAGGHIWNEADVIKLYEEQKSNGNDTKKSS